MPAASSGGHGVGSGSVGSGSAREAGSVEAGAGTSRVRVVLEPKNNTMLQTEQKRGR